ncbi:MAG: c-type cytochrome [Rhodocyclales bacterium]|nr:c-type cytochrome [Rhodocyclales bacterium]
MKNALALFLILLLLPWQAAWADAASAGHNPRGYGNKEYVWGELVPERAEVLKLSGDAVRGKEAFRVCRGCHKADAAGAVDGTYPRLTGQHASVVIKQVTEVRADVRINPKMEPFSADHAVSPQEIADIAVFLAAAETTRENGKGEGDFVAKGKRLYEEGKCMKCHGRSGEGDAEKAYPALAAQHYGYLMREMDYVQSGVRGNSHPEMVMAIRSFTHRDIAAVADYLSRLPDYRQSLAAEKGK